MNAFVAQLTVSVQRGHISEKQVVEAITKMGDEISTKLKKLWT